MIWKYSLLFRQIFKQFLTNRVLKAQEALEWGVVNQVVPDDQLSLAIGRRGQNVRLASMLSGWDIDILTEDEESRRRQEEVKQRSQMFMDALDVDDVIAGAWRALKPGGRFCIALKLGEGEDRDRIGRFYAYYSEAELKGLLADAGFTVTGQRTGAEAGLDGKVWPWIGLQAHA